MERTTTTILGYNAWMSIDDGLIEASYDETILDELTYVIEGCETEDGYVIPEETGIDQQAWQCYADALVTWVAERTGIAAETLRDAWHPEIVEPYLQYQHAPGH